MLKSVFVCAVFWIGPFVDSLTLFGLQQVQGKVQDASKASDERQRSTAPQHLVLPGIENAFRLSPSLYSGGEPRGEASFKALQALGVKTIISVDGARTDVDAARKFGMRYVHLPVGYDGVPREQAVRLVQATRSLPGPVFVHCHHGKHRGPTAAGLCAISVDGWSKAKAIDWLMEAGTSPDYRGLFATVSNFETPSAEELRRIGTDLPEHAKVAALVEAMVEIDKHWDQLKEIRAAGYKAPASHPDIDPTHEALQLAEAFRELQRLDETDAKGAPFVRLMGAAQKQATSLLEEFKSRTKVQSAEAAKTLDAAFTAVGKSCSTCHSRFRDRGVPDLSARSSSTPSRP
jgi:protein tyrosine phosphatase (PTP) superfamily phosphohydrolase (DUF442 family)